ncbi:MAG: hypothetical protein AAFY75_08785, partial [Pseudomonadota bacterium]
MTEHGATEGRSFSRKWAVLVLGVICLSVLAACADREFILPGPREDVRSVLSDSAAPGTDEAAAVADAARSI